MNRRAVVIGLGAMIAAPRLAQAQQERRVWRVGFIASSSPITAFAGPNPPPPFKDFLNALLALGYIEGRNLIIERRSAEGRYDGVPAIVFDLVRLKCDVIVVVSNSVARRAKAATSVVPIVMAASGNPVEDGLVQSLARPSGNITGLDLNAGAEVNGKRVELLREAVPKVSRIGYIGFRQELESAPGQAAQASARALGLTLILAEPVGNGYETAFRVHSRESGRVVCSRQQREPHCSRDNPQFRASDPPSGRLPIHSVRGRRGAYVVWGEPIGSLPACR